MTARGGVRAAWLYETIRECQAFVGDAFGICADDPVARAEAFLARLPKVENRVEALLQRGLLLETALQWGDLAHRAFHKLTDARVGDASKCSFVPAAAVEGWFRELGTSGTHAFAGWSRRFAREFVAAHPLLPACRAERFIERHYATPIRAKQVAQLVKCSPARLERTFSTLTGASLREFQTRIRLRHAIRLLQTTDLTVDAIAREVGYGSKKDLYRLLRTRVGLTPDAVRKQARRKVARRIIA